VPARETHWRRLWKRPDSQVAISDIGEGRGSAERDKSKLTVGIGAIMDGIDFLLVDIEVEGAPIRDESNDIGLVETNVNGRRFFAYQSSGVGEILVEVEGVETILTNGELIVLGFVATKNDAPTITLDNTHLGLDSKVGAIEVGVEAKTGCASL